MKDPIVEEVHNVRQELLEEYGGMQNYFKHLLEIQEQMKDRIVSHPSRPPVRIAPHRRHG